VSPGLQLALVLVALLGSAFFSGLETGVVSINPFRLRHLARKKVPGATLLQAFLDHPDHLLGTTLVGNNLCNVVASVTAVSLGTELAGRTGTSLAYVTITLVTLICCEYLPKAWFQGQPARRALPFARLLHLFGRLLYPFSRVILLLSRVLVPIRTRGEIWQPALTREEFGHLTEAGTRAGALSREEGHMMHQVMGLSSTPCRQLMVPRDRMRSLSADADTGHILSAAQTHRLSRLPVHDADSGLFIGIVYIFDVLADPTPEGKTARDYLRPPQFVDEDQSALDVLPRMRRSQQPLALLTNRQGRVTGLVTVEDLLAHIVGPLGGGR